MLNERLEVIMSVERRRRWSVAEKRRLVAAMLNREPACPQLPEKPGFIQVNVLGGGGRCAQQRFCAVADCG